MDKKTLSIIIPVFNEFGNLPRLFESLKNLAFSGWEYEIIIVEDASVDGSRDWLESNKNTLGKNAKLLLHKQNLGKGGAIKTGINEAQGDFAVILDSDNEYKPKDIEKLLGLASRDAVIFGNRVNDGWRGYWFFVLGNFLMNWAISLVSRQKMKDAYTGFKLMSLDMWKNLNLEETGFAMEAEITAKILRNKIEIFFIPISYTPRTFKQGKKITLWDGFYGFWAFLKFYFKKTD